MNIYYYTHTGHRFGLDRFRTAVALFKVLQDLDITLLTSDYRIASSSQEFGIEKSVGLDVFRNIPNIAEHGDILFYDSDEESETQLLDMIDFFSKFIRISLKDSDYPRKGEFLINPYIEDSDNSFKYLPVENSYFGDFHKNIEMLLFFGDDDYDKDLVKYLQEFKSLKPDLLLGFYFFLGYEEELAKYTNNIYENEDYEQTIKHSKHVITSSYQTALQTLASGGQPIYIERMDRESYPNRYLESLGIPVLNSFDENKILEVLNSNVQYKEINNRDDELKKVILQFMEK